MTATALERRERRKAWGFALPAVLWTAAFFLVPFLYMAAISFWKREGREIVATWTLDNYAAFFGKPHLLKALVNSLEVTLTVTIVSILLAYPLAWIIAERVPRRWQRFALIMAILPFWTSYVVRSYSWLLVLSKGGVVNQSLMWMGLIAEPLELSANRTGTVIGFVHFFVMLLTLTIYANLVQLSPNYRRAAADLGANAFQTFWHVILPLTLPGIMVGAFLTFVLCIGDYITPQILGGNNELVLPQVIMLQLGRRADFPMAAALSLVLMVVVTIAYIACARWLKMERT
ncbi:spermidine/putrescine transport system permease protein [Peteryoungia aggregata LMG 23059]|uniref:Spermidine/putrescine transport system permease protein n=1 Tax=Peteryoungia aggregata LMG 23059 TaxID=1368425 RepID=A0ABU0G2W5_9HYPH|nr:ABC transporter permease [Peteryoungia aggregata]MDQ0419652.1 spermidine/putrescine transport system permease protein [Peteryoungia aggregata LMG 23059]